MDKRRWSELPADVLREISARVWAAADFSYFHAVCKPWRNSRDPPSQRTTQFLPWLLAPSAEKESAHLNFRCVFSNASYRATPASPVPRSNWVCSADGSAFWYLTVENRRPSLHDPLTGEVKHLPLFPYRIGKWEKENPSGAVYGDGSTFLYIIIRIRKNGVKKVWFKAVLLNPGDAEWMVVERTFQTKRYCSQFYAAYHGGKIMVTMEDSLWHVIALDGHNIAVADVWGPKPLPSSRCWCQYNYLLESRGELLWALIQVVENYEYYHDRVVNHELSLLVYALEEEEEEDSAPKKTMRWVWKDGHSLADRVLFLGWPNSFAVDASRLGGGEDGACAYLAYYGRGDLPRREVGVYRFNLVSHKTELIEQLPREWNQGKCTWVIPQPAVTPIQELTERRLIAREPKRTPITSPITHIKRYYGPSFRASVRNLPLSVTSSHLRLFLSKHGKVSSAEVLYYRKTKRSQGIGIFTMSTIHARVEDSLEALNDLFLHGYRFEVRLVKGERRRLGMS